MSKDKIFEIIKKHIIEIMGDIDEIDINKSLKDYGANSIDRADITMITMEEIGCKIPLIEFGNLKNIQGIVDVFYAKTND
ncbi:phosphopantetheine-binding protein [Clostridium estertheticum]|uniref:phosphopantetheine-binding protein n=1 Tax=Clostridium estertheticum TaxID=238834 RepID=UPI0013EEC974|nr:phosphopantetheine-binding protein [Clostridium estertheticum]MBZ9609912.1 phosphopantetheine-binding protein [Clostridium estertheticum]